MLVTKLKATRELKPLLTGSVFLVKCRGCREVGFPEAEAAALEKELAAAGGLTGVMTTDYICHPENLRLRLRPYFPGMEEADRVLVLSCGVGVQTLADLLEDRTVCAGCDTIELPGSQGVTPTEVDCDRCGTCFLNLTGGICPITACSKSLVNGPCGGTDRGKCEVDPAMECGWERIYRKLEKQGRLDVLQCPVKLRDYSTDEATKARKEV